MYIFHCVLQTARAVKELEGLTIKSQAHNSLVNDPVTVFLRLTIAKVSDFCNVGLVPMALIFIEHKYKYIDHE